MVPARPSSTLKRENRGVLYRQQLGSAVSEGMEKKWAALN